MRDRLKAWLEVATRFHRYRSLWHIESLIAARRVEDSFEVHYFKHGVLVAAATASHLGNHETLSELLRQTAHSDPTPSPSEIGLNLRWLYGDDVILIECSSSWHSPWPSQQSHLSMIESIAKAQSVGDLMDLRKHSLPYTTPR
jgi:hypothetical protein